jgi:hypothetical protein
LIGIATEVTDNTKRLLDNRVSVTSMLMPFSPAASAFCAKEFTVSPQLPGLKPAENQLQLGGENGTSRRMGLADGAAGGAYES